MAAVMEMLDRGGAAPRKLSVPSLPTAAREPARPGKDAAGPPLEQTPPPWLEPPPWEEEPVPPRHEEAVRSPPLVPPPPPLAPADAWPDIIKQMRLVGMSLQLANHCILLALEESRITLGLDPRHSLLRSGQAEVNLEKALQTYFKRPLKLQFRLEKPEQETPASQIQRHKEERQQAAEQEIEQDPVVLALKERLDARIVPGSIKPLD